MEVVVGLAADLAVRPRQRRAAVRADPPGALARSLELLRRRVGDERGLPGRDRVFEVPAHTPASRPAGEPPRVPPSS